MKKNLVSAESVRQAILHRITTGQYHAGDPLPSVRGLAEELGSNRNTVMKAYHLLLDVGVIEHMPGGRKGFRVCGAAQGDNQSRGELLNYFYQQSVNLIWKGMAAGIRAEEMYDQLSAAVDEVYRQSSVAYYFVECNEQDSQEMSHALHRALGVRVDCGLLDDLRENLTRVTANYDLVITTFHHMSELLNMLRQAGFPTSRVVGIDTRPTPETLLGIVRFPERCIGLVSTMSNTLHMLKYIILSYHPDWQIETATIDNRSEVLRVAACCAHLVVTHTCMEEVQAIIGRKPDVIVNFQIDEQSILFLRNRTQELQRARGLPGGKGLAAQAEACKTTGHPVSTPPTATIKETYANHPSKKDFQSPIGNPLPKL